MYESTHGGVRGRGSNPPTYSIDFLKQENITPFVKYNYFHKEQQKGSKAYTEFSPANLFYNQETDTYYCPMGQAMPLKYTRKEKSASGYEKTLHIYEAINCKSCSLRGACHKSKHNRQIQVNHRLNKLRTEAKEHLSSEEGLKHRSQRPVDVEASFGNLKHNKNFKRFLLRGKEKVELEIGLLALAINLKKMHKLKTA